MAYRGVVETLLTHHFTDGSQIKKFVNLEAGTDKTDKTYSFNSNSWLLASYLVLLLTYSIVKGRNLLEAKDDLIAAKEEMLSLLRAGHNRQN